MSYILPYILLICFFGIMSWWHYVVEGLVAHIWSLILCGIALIFFFGFRGFCFYDWMSYYPAFLQLNVNNISNADVWSWEPGFALLMTLCKTVSSKYWFFELVCSCINTTLLLFFLKRNVNNIPLGIALFICFGGLFLMTDLMRNSIAILVYVNCLTYIVERKPIKYFIGCAVAICFHFSSVLYIPCYFFLNRRIPRKLLALVFVVGCAAFALKIPLFSSSLETLLSVISPDLENKVHWYLNEMNQTRSGIDIVFLERVGTAMLVLFYIEKLRDCRKNANIYINALFIYFLFNFYFAEFVTFSSRMALLFTFGYWIVWYDLIKCFSFNNNRKLFILFVWLYCCARMTGLTKSILARYDNILFDSETYQRRESIYNKNFKE